LHEPLNEVLDLVEVSQSEYLNIIDVLSFVIPEIVDIYLNDFEKSY